MTVAEIMRLLPLTVLTAQENLEREITGGFASDLLSNVMGQARPGQVWVTMQGHQNIVAVASLIGLAAVIIAGGAQVDEAVVTKANNADVILLTTPLPTFDVVGQLYSQGIRGS